MTEEFKKLHSGAECRSCSASWDKRDLKMCGHGPLMHWFCGPCWDLELNVSDN